MTAKNPHAAAHPAIQSNDPDFLFFGNGRFIRASAIVSSGWYAYFRGSDDQEFIVFTIGARQTLCGKEIVAFEQWAKARSLNLSSDRAQQEDSGHPASASAQPHQLQDSSPIAAQPALSSPGTPAQQQAQLDQPSTGQQPSESPFENPPALTTNQDAGGSFLPTESEAQKGGAN